MLSHHCRTEDDVFVGVRDAARIAGIGAPPAARPAPAALYSMRYRIGSWNHRVRLGDLRETGRPRVAICRRLTLSQRDLLRNCVITGDISLSGTWRWTQRTRSGEEVRSAIHAVVHELLLVRRIVPV